MSDRKCKSAGATDTQLRNTKGARCRPSTRYAALTVCVRVCVCPSLLSILFRSLLSVPVNMFTAKSMYYAPARATRGLFELDRRDPSLAYQHRY